MGDTQVFRGCVPCPVCGHRPVIAVEDAAMSGDITTYTMRVIEAHAKDSHCPFAHGFSERQTVSAAASLVVEADETWGRLVEEWNVLTAVPCLVCQHRIVSKRHGDGFALRCDCPIDRPYGQSEFHRRYPEACRDNPFGDGTSAGGG